jgi:ribonuclease-3
MLDADSLQSVQDILGYRFADESLLVEALTHASSADSRVASNERLEFLGDSVLGLVVCDHLFRTYPDLLEGDLTKIKSVAVSRRTCAKIARRLGLGDLLVLGKGMQVAGELPSSLLAAALESVIGAMYLDAGYERVHAFLLPVIEPIVDQAQRSGHQQNFKSVLQHVAQERHNAMPTYVLLDEKGPDHAKCFEVCVELSGRRFESCWGQSKKQAEQMAALQALEAMGVARRNDEGEVEIIDDEEAEAALDDPVDAVSEPANA